ncbi:MAG: alpha/beta fold hydrolase [Gordonia sp. (in: high G+C Gram-positive bacteria)]|uniref:alpha/beta fold hydrolase n=1 Tax=Gordonia sp. (in: high G+C Gram-positive bacteria) TaxID=84139 RepID=UPI0039E236C9
MTAVFLMAGTGSDDDYLRRSFGPAIAEAGGELHALAPTAHLVDDYLATLDEVALAAREEGRAIVVGGVSIGAVVALRWALRRGGADCAGVLAALPPWSGPVGDSVAALSARITADALERDGLEPTIAAMAATSPDWLAAELSRSWRSLHDRDLVGQLRLAARCAAPTVDEIAALPVPLAIAAAPDDPLHPVRVAHDWAAAAPRAAVVETPLSEWGPHSRLLGDACLAAWRTAGGPALG